MTTNPRLTSRASVIRYWTATTIPFIAIGAFVMTVATEMTMRDNVMIILGVWFLLFVQRTFDGVAAARTEYKLYRLENEEEERVKTHVNLLLLSAADHVMTDEDEEELKLWDAPDASQPE